MITMILGILGLLEIGRGLIHDNVPDMIIGGCFALVAVVIF